MSGYVAYCDARGVIDFGRFHPPGTLPILRARTLRRLRDEIEPAARLAYDNKTLLVPGIPEAPDQRSALNALIAWMEWRGWPLPNSRARAPS